MLTLGGVSGCQKGTCPSPIRLCAPDFARLQDGRSQKLEKAKVSLNDCLACSGCVTSAETILITQQSHEELRKVLDANKVSSGAQPQPPTAYSVRGNLAGPPVWLPASLGFVALTSVVSVRPGALGWVQNVTVAD